MKKMILVIFMFLSGVLSACVTNDMMNNNFTAISTQPISSNLARTWTGSMSVWLVTMKIYQNGEGLYCYAGPTQSGLQKIKVNNDVVYVQDGTKFNITGVQANSIQLKAPYLGVKEHTLYSDQDLNKASVFCQKELSSSS